MSPRATERKRPAHGDASVENTMRYIASKGALLSVARSVTTKERLKESITLAPNQGKCVPFQTFIDAEQLTIMRGALNLYGPRIGAVSEEDRADLAYLIIVAYSRGATSPEAIATTLERMQDERGRLFHLESSSVTPEETAAPIPLTSGPSVSWF